ncbi:uncharacterized protein BO96DRAFT_338263 [Aspergillus niger CBS 101883]|uniref:Uncharacterized protein n=2 Tax=Aspergillus niger TaxID=5061 RepID=A2RBD1_ASPNC|nr:uncharacterized protein BO96DRAFT_338263 [Aspergillus niger CBS 101883]XP_059602996.1 hypothetical protein An18g06300 [Aspergillus niger]PYH56466.1 hypothetical protein BO96DRAFT_338263 [Aspergillus niger CBS 101883]CAK43355.1 hypothetical protein An18g06300 [Aspergillus niger]
MLAGGSSTRNSPQTLAPWLLMYYFVQHEGIVFATHAQPSLKTGSSTAIPRLLPHKSRQSLERITGQNPPGDIPRKARGSWVLAVSSSSSSRKLLLGGFPRIHLILVERVRIVSDDSLLALACPGSERRLRWLANFPNFPSILISLLLALLRSRGN